MKSKILAVVLLVGFATCANANLIRNPSFETIPGSVLGQGIMPSEWTTAHVTAGPGADTYSNDGSYGVSPSELGNFTGVTALDGIRWVAGWSAADEHFGQTLSAPFIGGQSYMFSGYLIQAKRSNLDHPGGYALYLTPDATGNIGAGALLGNIGPTTNSNDWEFFL